MRTRARRGREDLLPKRVAHGQAELTLVLFRLYLFHREEGPRSQPDSSCEQTQVLMRQGHAALSKRALGNPIPVSLSVRASSPQGILRWTQSHLIPWL